MVNSEISIIYAVLTISKKIDKDDRSDKDDVGSKKLHTFGIHYEFDKEY